MSPGTQSQDTSSYKQLGWYVEFEFPGDATHAGIPGLKIASLHVGWSSLYDIPRGPHSKRHPEIYDGGHQFNHVRAHTGGLK